MNVAQSLGPIFRQVFELAATADVDQLAYRGLPAWDSVGHMRLVAALEDAFDIMLETEDVIDLSSFAKAVEIVRRYLGD